MASPVDMSLEDIIQRNKRNIVRSKGIPRGIKNNKSPKPLPVTDARNKIISKKRTQITDAREKLGELARKKDARLKLEQMRKKRELVAILEGRSNKPNRGRYPRAAPNNERVFIDPSRQVVSHPLTYNHKNALPPRRQQNIKRILENRSIQTRTFESRPKLKPILRTVENDLDLHDEPMIVDEYTVAPKLPATRKGNLQLRIIAQNNNDRPSRSSASRRLATPEKDGSPPRPPSILKKRPMAALRLERKEEKTEKPALEYRIIVSNLRSTVTGDDIKELFGDVGGMMESRLVRPGTAEVIYKTLEDAQRAVELYHNRQLDGQPMNCLLVTPRSNAATASKSSRKPALISSNSNVEPDLSTFHKVLFSHF